MEPVEIDDNPDQITGPQGRNFVWRITFPFTEGRGWEKGVPRLLDFTLFPTWVTYCIYSLEIGDETQAHHFQGYLEVRGKKSYKQVHEIPGLERAWLRLRMGTQNQGIAYASKADDPTFLEGPWIHGEPKEQGKRNDLLEVRARLDNNEPMRDIMQEHFSSWVRHNKSFKEYKRLKTKPRTRKSLAFLFVGPAGKGKSTLMKLLASYLGSVYFVPAPKGSGLYWDDYDGEDVVILDEFDGHVMRPTFFNMLIDEHPCVVPVHGGAGHQFTSRYVFIGSNYLPKQWWRARNHIQLRQTTRRIDVVFKVGFTNIPAAPEPPKPLRINEWNPTAKRTRVIGRFRSAAEIIADKLANYRANNLPPKDKEEENE